MNLGDTVHSISIRNNVLARKVMSTGREMDQLLKARLTTKTIKKCYLFYPTNDISLILKKENYCNVHHINKIR